MDDISKTVVECEKNVTVYEDMKCRSLELGQLLTNIKALLIWSNATPIRSHGGIGYVCCFCSKQFPDPADLKVHTKAMHKDVSKASIFFKKDMSGLIVKVDITALQCNICNKNIEMVDDLLKHLKTDHDKVIFTDVKNQILPFKFNSELLECFICLNRFNKFKLLVSHMNVHCRNYMCKLCDLGFVNRSKLQYHTKRHASGTFSCEFCPKVFDTLPKKISHVTYAHNDSHLRNRCGYCREAFKSYYAKEKHLFEVHKVVNLGLKCNACDKMFITRSSLRVHMQKDHLLMRKFECNLCDMKFYRRQCLVKHMTKHTGAREFQCEICLKFYCRRTTLKQHMRIHADDRRYKCEHCGQAFVQKCSWKGHVRNKHGEEVE